MERRSFLKSVGLSPLATIKPHGDYERAEENGWKFVFWGWRDSFDSTTLTAFWTAHKGDQNIVSVVRRQNSPYTECVHYHCGEMFFIGDSLDALDAMKRGATEFSQSQLDAVFAQEKAIALDRLREHVRKL